MNALDTITILLSRRPKILTKRIRGFLDGSMEIIGFDSAKHFSIREGGFDNLRDLVEVLSEYEKNPCACVVRGAPLPTTNRKYTQRLLDKHHPEDGTFTEKPRWSLFLDFDTIPLEDDPYDYPDECVTRATKLLPPCFTGVSCFWQFTSGARIKPGLRIRLGFVLDRPLGEDELKGWLPKTVDHSVFSPVQPIYIARPIFDGFNDPIPVRSGIFRSSVDVVPVPAVLEPPKGEAKEEDGGARGYEAWCELIGDHPGGKGFHDPILRAVGAYIAKNGAGANITWLKQNLPGRIRKADHSKHTDRDVEERIGKLDEIIKWTVEQEKGREAKEKHAAKGRIEKFNERYAVVNEAGKMWVFERVRDPMLDRRVLYHMDFSDFGKMYMNVPAPDPWSDAADEWLHSPNRRQYLGGVVCDPTGTASPDRWNLWSGFGVEPKEGDWSLMEKHVKDVICGGDDAHSEYLLNLLGYKFQNPERQAEVCVVLRGKKGTGKGVFLGYLVKACGQHGLHISNAEHLTGRFNEHLRDCIVLFVDEAFFAGDRKHEGILKALITEPTIAIEGKYKRVVTAKNMLAVVMASNSDWVVPATDDERRYLMLDVIDRERGNRKYFNDLVAQMESGGLSAMLHHLLHRDLSGFDHRAVPRTKALDEQIEMSLDTIDRWLLAVLERGFPLRSRFGNPDLAGWDPVYTTEFLNRSYQQWCTDNKINRPEHLEAVARRLKEIYGEAKRGPRGVALIVGEVEVVRQSLWWGEDGPNLNQPVAPQLLYGKERQRVYSVGNIDEAREEFTKKRGVKGSWTDKKRPDLFAVGD